MYLQACCAGHGIEDVNCCEYSFAAKPGWDAATGLGSPNFAIISNLVIDADATFPAVSSTDAFSPVSASSGNTDDGTAEEAKDIAIASIVLSFISVSGLLWLYFRPTSALGLSTPLNSNA